MDLLVRLKAQSAAISHLHRISGVPALSLGVFDQGKIVHTEHFGNLDAATPHSDTPNNDSIYRVASIFKIVTVCAIARLVTDGVLDWDAPVRNYLPQLERREDEVGLKATVRDLISNRSGLPMESFYWAQQAGELLLDKSEFVRVVSYIKAVRPFRSTFIYSQWNFCLLHILVEELSGKPFSVFVKESIFDPLGMESSTFGIPAGDSIAVPHAVRNDGTACHIPNNIFPDHTGITAGAGAKSSIKEVISIYIHLLAAYSHQRTHNVDTTPNSPFTQLRTIFSPHIRIGKTDLDHQSYCLGLYRTRLPGNLSCASINGPLLRSKIPIFGASDRLEEEIFHHSGTIPGFFGGMYLVPRTHSGVVVLTNATPLMDAADFSAQLLLAAIFNTPPPENLIALAQTARKAQITWYEQASDLLESGKTDTRPTHALDAYAGVYVNEFGFFLRVVTANDGLRLSVQDKATGYDLKPWDGDSFYWEVSRDRELCDKGMWLYPLPQWHIVHFQVGERGVEGLEWQHDGLAEAKVYNKVAEHAAAKL